MISHQEKANEIIINNIVSNFVLQTQSFNEDPKGMNMK